MATVIGASPPATIPDHRIRNQADFDKVTGNPRESGGIYFYCMLDCMIELAHEVARDFFKRPHLYTDMKEAKRKNSNLPSLSDNLAKLKFHYGNDPAFLSQPQRKTIYEALFGMHNQEPSSERGDFARLRDQLVQACAAFAERVFDTGVEMLRERVRTTHVPFRQYLIGLSGDSVNWTKDHALRPLAEDFSYDILRSEGVRSVFGISIKIHDDWPFVEDSNGDKIVSQISQQLRWPGEGHQVITREHFSNLQRAALRGTEAIATVIDFDETKKDADLDLLITKCYTWGAALKSIPTTVREAAETEVVRELPEATILRPAELMRR